MAKTRPTKTNFEKRSHKTGLESSPDVRVVECEKNVESARGELRAEHQQSDHMGELQREYESIGARHRAQERRSRRAQLTTREYSEI